MTKTELKQELTKLVGDFFTTSDVTIAGPIKDEIYSKVLNCTYSESSTRLIINSMTIWKVDVSNYLTTLNTNDKHYKHMAYVALVGIITFVDLSLLEN